MKKTTTTTTLEKLASTLNRPIRDTEINRAAAEKLISLIEILPLDAVNAAADKMLETGLTIEEKDTISQLNATIADRKEQIDSKKQFIKQLQSEISDLKMEIESCNKQIATICHEAGIETKKPRVHSSLSDLTDEEKKERVRQQKREANRRWLEKKKAEKAAAENVA